MTQNKTPRGSFMGLARDQASSPGVVLPGSDAQAALTVNPVQTTTYYLSTSNNPITLGASTDIVVQPTTASPTADAVYGGPLTGGEAWSVTNFGTLSGDTTSLGNGVNLLANGTVTNQAGGTVAGYDAVYIQGAGVVTNSGVLTGTSGASGLSSVVTIEGGGSVTNTAGASITGYGGGIYIIGGAGLSSVTNSGGITTTGFAGGVWLNPGGDVYNEAGASIVVGSASTVLPSVRPASFGGYDVAGYNTSVTNAGYMFSFFTGVALETAGPVVNQATGVILAEAVGVSGSGGPLSVTNAGSITANGAINSPAWLSQVYPANELPQIGSIIGDGVAAESGGTIVNSGAIEGSSLGVFIDGGPGVVTNSGRISGGAASVEFGGSGANTLTLETNSILVGEAIGSTASGAVNALVLQGSGVANNVFVNFNSLTLQTGASWTLGGASTFGSLTVSGVALTVAGQLTIAGPLSGAGTIDVAPGADLTLDNGAVAGPTPITFLGSGGTLTIVGATMPTDVIAGLSAGNIVDLKSIAYTPSSASVRIVAGNTLQIIEAGVAYDLSLAAGALSPGHFSLSADTSGTGTAVTFTPGPPAPSDFNDDAQSDILWRNTNGQVSLWLANGTGGYSASIIATVATSWTIQAAGDFNGDGKADILWRNANGDVAEWQSNSGSGYTGFTNPDLGVVATSWQVNGVGDFNGDGKADILWRNTSGLVSLWLSNAGAGYMGYTTPVIAQVDPSWAVAGVGDFNGDGKADILWRNANGDVAEWLSNTGAGYTGFTAIDLGVVPTSWTIQGVGDFNGDGKADILWRNTNGQISLWLSNAGSGFTGYTTPVIATIDPSWVIQGVRDFNGDGKADILWRNTNGNVAEWLSNTGAGYTGFTGPVIASVAAAWTIASDTPPALASVSGGGVTRLSQAMAAMAGDGPAIVSTPATQPTLSPIIAASGHG